MAASHVVDYDCLFPEFLELRECDVFGRGVYARKNLHPGIELIQSDSLVHVISLNERGSCCDWCISRKESLRKCSQCKFVRYCSISCQKLDWSLHKVECKGIARITPNVPTNTIRLLVRLLAKKTMRHESKTFPGGGEWEMDLLTSHVPRYSEELKQSLTEQVFGAKLLIGDTIEFNTELAYNIACKIVSNSFSILDSEMNSIGAGIYIIPALFNHSCNPNCVVLFDGCKMKLRTIREIAQNEQLFVSYTDLLDTGERRRKHLQKYYLFCCSCDRCHDDKMEGSLNSLMYSTRAIGGVTESEKKRLMSDGFSKLEEAEKLKNKRDWQGIREFSLKYLTDNLMIFGDLNIIVVKMREILMDSYIELCQWEEALKVARSLKPAYEKYYPPINPFIGLHLFKMCKLINQTCDDTPNLQHSMELLDRVIGILTITHGGTHPYVEESKGILKDLHTEITERLTQDEDNM